MQGNQLYNKKQQLKSTKIDKIEQEEWYAGNCENDDDWPKWIVYTQDWTSFSKTGSTRLKDQILIIRNKEEKKILSFKKPFIKIWIFPENRRNYWTWK